MASQQVSKPLVLMGKACQLNCKGSNIVSVEPVTPLYGYKEFTKSLLQTNEWTIIKRLQVENNRKSNKQTKHRHIVTGACELVVVFVSRKFS